MTTFPARTLLTSIQHAPLRYKQWRGKIFNSEIIEKSVWSIASCQLIVQFY